MAKTIRIIKMAGVSAMAMPLYETEDEAKQAKHDVGKYWTKSAIWNVRTFLKRPGCIGLILDDQNHFRYITPENCIYKLVTGEKFGKAKHIEEPKANRK